MEVEIEVAPDGKLLRKCYEPLDDEDEEEDDEKDDHS